MDVYGYNAFPYNQSDELAKQMYAHQALGAQNRPAPEPHAMPNPSGAPWNVQGMPWGLPSPPQLVQFTAQQPAVPRFSPIVHCKRKSIDVEPVIPPKQLITEEKMAAHLNGLHISSDYTNHSLSYANEEVMDINMDSTLPSVRERLKGHKIVLSDEIKKLTEEPLLPASLIERLEKPCMSLVVWKPKDHILDEKLKEIEDKVKQITDKQANKEESEQLDVKRNGVLVPDLGMDVEM